MTDIERYELIRPILLKEQTTVQVHDATGVPLSTLYRYVSRYNKDGIEGLRDKSHAVDTHPHWFTEAEKSIVVRYKLEHPQLSAREIAKHLSESGELHLSDRSVTNILNAQGIPLTFFPSTSAA